MRVDGNQGGVAGVEPNNFGRWAEQLFDNTARAIKGARPQTVEKHIENRTQADPAYGEGVRKACEALGAL